MTRENVAGRCQSCGGRLAAFNDIQLAVAGAYDVSRIAHLVSNDVSNSGHVVPLRGRRVS